MMPLVFLKPTYRDDKIVVGFIRGVARAFWKVRTVRYDRESLRAQTESPTIELDLKFCEGY